MVPKWLDWAQRLQAIAQNGLHYARDPFDVERYEAVREIAAEMAATCSDADTDALRALFAGQEGHATPNPFHTYKVFFQGELTGGEPAYSVETDGVGFFREDELPELSVMRVTPGQVARFFQHHRHSDWPTDFD